MPEAIQNTEARERVLEAAEKLFAERGYSSVTLRDVGTAVGIRHTSLYHHVPGGKEALYIEVTKRTLARHREGLTESIRSAEPTVRAQLYAAAEWLLSQPPMDLIRMIYSDMPAINPVQAEQLSEEVYESITGPIRAALKAADQRGEIWRKNYEVIAGGFLGMITSLHAAPDTIPNLSRREMANQLIDVMLDGLSSKP